MIPATTLRTARTALTVLVVALLAATTAACQAPGDDGDDPNSRADSSTPTDADSLPTAGRAPADTTDPADGGAGARPATRMDTIELEGMPEPIALRLFRTPDDFPLPFSAYVPEDMVASAEAPGGVRDSATAHFVAEFGGQRNEDAFLHLYVFPAGTPGEEATAHARGYGTARGIPVSRGVEPLPDPAPPALEWAVEGYRFRYQGASGWIIGSLGVGQHQDRFFLIVRHFPAEYGDGFGPRADLILETWRWGDGGGL